MKQKLLFILMIFSLGGCKKAIQQAEQNAVIQAMTTGQWVVTQFTDNSTDITSDFA